MIYTFRISRFDPRKDPAPYEQEFPVDLGDADKVTVLDALFKIQQTQDKTLSFRYSCRGAVCGSCAMRVGGQIVLACRTPVEGLLGMPVLIEPSPSFL
jgi:succinate dehydrogenase / fumarate reductase iron-sulfur subunit